MAPQEQIQNLLALARRLIFDPRMSKWTIPLQLLGEVVLCSLIIWKVPCT
jgi:alpha-1,3-mannosyltransferase